jgi:hypothetical protein
MLFPYLFSIMVVVAILSVILRRKRSKRRSRWKTSRPAPVDLGPWREFARTMGLRLSQGDPPRIHGDLSGDDFRIERLWADRPRTRARVRAATRRSRPGNLRVRPRGDRDTTDFEHPTGDGAFDREFRVHCFTEGMAERILTDEVRAWIRALEDVEVEVSGKVATATVPGFEDDPDRLRGLLELSRAVARRMRNGGSE